MVGAAAEPVELGGVEHRHPQLVRLAQRADVACLVAALAVGHRHPHRPEADRGDLEPLLTKLAMFHPCPFRRSPGPPYPDEGEGDRVVAEALPLHAPGGDGPQPRVPRRLQLAFVVAHQGADRPEGQSGDEVDRVERAEIRFAEGPGSEQDQAIDRADGRHRQDDFGLSQGDRQVEARLRVGFAL